MGQYCSCFSKKYNYDYNYNISKIIPKIIISSSTHEKNNINDIIIKKIAIKIPHGIKYIEYNDKIKSFVKHDDINLWIKSLYKGKEIPNYIIYNDDTHIIGDKHTKKGHCKGILTWNKNNISFLCHSIPNFPEKFEEGYISDIKSNELIFGQSLIFIEFQYDETKLYNILRSIHIMQAHIYIEKNLPIIKYISYNNIITTKISDNITYIVKPPSLNIDIYSDYLCKEYKYQWFIETWKRGHRIINETCNNPIDIKKLKFEDTEYLETCDHSKWAVCDNYFTIGDLNRMTSQFTRGGGLILCKDSDISIALKKLIVS